MSETSVLLQPPSERQHPILLTTAIRPIDEVLRASEADGRDLNGAYEADEDLRQRIATFESGYAEIAANGEVSVDEVHHLIDGLYADEAIQRRAEHLATRPVHGDPTITTDIDFCLYLDFALPIDPSDTVTPVQARDGRLYWIDHILREGERIVRRQQPYIESEAVESPVKTLLSTELRQELAEYKASTINAKWWDTARLAGGTALVTTSETVLPHAVTTPGVIAGIALGGWGALRATGRLLNRSGLKDAAKSAEAREQLAALLPAYNLPHGREFAEKGFELEYRAAELENEQTESEIGDSFWRAMALHRFVKDYFTFSRYGGMEQGLAWVVKDMLTDYADAQRYELNHRSVEMTAMAGVLDKYVPIDQERDTTTPVDVVTGQKTWRGYIEALSENKANIQRIAELISYPTNLITDRQIS